MGATPLIRILAWSRMKEPLESAKDYQKMRGNGSG
jgi:hypothetical protein